MTVIGRGDVPVGVLGHGGVLGPVLEGDLGVVGGMVLERTDKVSPVEVYMFLGVVRVDKLVVVFKLVLMEVGKVSLVLSLRGSKKFSTGMV